MAGNAQMPAHNVDEHRVALGRPDRREMANSPKDQTDQPEPQAETEITSVTPARFSASMLAR